VILPVPAPSSPRVVSLLPSATEILGVINATHLLVGRSHECDFPLGIERLPVLTRARIRHADPRDIDAAVSAAVEGGESLYDVDADALAALRPDFILTQDLCRVCSVDLSAVRRIADALSPVPEVLSLNPTSVEGVLDDILRVADALGRAADARRALVVLRERLFRAQDFVNPFADGPSVAFLEWTDPLFGAGHWTVQLIERAGGRHPINPTVPDPHAGAAAGFQQAQRRAGPSPRLTADALIASAPDAIVIAPCGFTLEQTVAAALKLSDAPWWDDLPAVRQGRVAVVDGNQMFNRPGPRLVDAFEWLVGWLNDRPELIPPGFPWRAMTT